MYSILALHPPRAQRFGTYFSRADEPSHPLLSNYPWTTHTKIVDVGGSHGSISISLAERFPNLSCIVQDLPATVAEGEARLPEHLRGRVTFMSQ